MIDDDMLRRLKAEKAAGRMTVDEETIAVGNPDDVPLESLKVTSLGEDGDAYIVEGTANPVLAEQALVAWWRKTIGDEDRDFIVGDLLPVARIDWYWQVATPFDRTDAGDVVEDADAMEYLRAATPNVDGTRWGVPVDVVLNPHADEPLFRGVYFG